MTTDMDKLIADIEGLKIGRQPRPDAPFDAYVVSANNTAINTCIALIRKHQAEQQGGVVSRARCNCVDAHEPHCQEIF